MIGESVITRRKRIDAGIDMTPLIDVVFQLLIFLMVSSQFTKPEQAIDLPQTPGESSLVDPSPDKLTVSLAENGEIFVNQELVALGDLRAKLSSWSASGNTKRVEIRGDRDGRYGRFVEVIEIVSLAGFDNVAIVKKPSHASE
jgi:biopolymer transport protein ExbD